LGIYIRNLLQKLLVQRRNIIKVSRSNIGKTITAVYNEQIEQYLKGVAAGRYVEPVIQYQLPEQTQVQEVICDFSEDLTIEDIVKCRICVVDQMIVLCSRRKVPQLKQCLPTFCQDPYQGRIAGA
jgi:hypothetical protein